MALWTSKNTFPNPIFSWTAAGLLLVTAVLVMPRTALFHTVKLRLLGRFTVAERVEQYGERARQRLAPHFEAAGVSYPPDRFLFAGFKQEDVLEVYAANAGEALKFIRSYPILAASGRLGPKLMEGDRQVPEGLYRIESLNPNSRFHLSIRVNYPNAHDRRRGAEEGRSDLGGDIMIHGNAVSIGCLAMGDPAAEELFILAAETGWQDVPIILSPVDFRTTNLPADFEPPTTWTAELHEQIKERVLALPASRRNR